MLTGEDARALITTSLTDDELEAVIAREEAWLARRIGPLEGERTETFVTGVGTETWELRRPTDAVTVEDDNGEIVVELRGWSDVVRTDDVLWVGDVFATYAPTDEAEVIRALISLVRLVINESAYESQTDGTYTAQVDHQANVRQRWAAWRSLLRPPQLRSIRVLPGPVAGSLGSVSTVAPAS